MREQLAVASLDLSKHVVERIYQAAQIVVRFAGGPNGVVAMVRNVAGGPRKVRDRP